MQREQCKKKNKIKKRKKRGIFTENQSQLKYVIEWLNNKWKTKIEIDFIQSSCRISVWCGRTTTIPKSGLYKPQIQHSIKCLIKILEEKSSGNKHQFQRPTTEKHCCFRVICNWRIYSPHYYMHSIRSNPIFVDDEKQHTKWMYFVFFFSSYAAARILLIGNEKRLVLHFRLGTFHTFCVLVCVCVCYFCFIFHSIFRVCNAVVVDVCARVPFSSRSFTSQLISI